MYYDLALSKPSQELNEYLLVPSATPEEMLCSQNQMKCCSDILAQFKCGFESCSCKVIASVVGDTITVTTYNDY